MAVRSQRKGIKVHENFAKGTEKNGKNWRVNEQSIVQIPRKRSHSCNKATQLDQQELRWHSRHVSRKNSCYQLIKITLQGHSLGHDSKIMGKFHHWPNHQSYQLHFGLAEEIRTILETHLNPKLPKQRRMVRRIVIPRSLHDRLKTIYRPAKWLVLVRALTQNLTIQRPEDRLIILPDHRPANRRWKLDNMRRHSPHRLKVRNRQGSAEHVDDMEKSGEQDIGGWWDDDSSVLEQDEKEFDYELESKVWKE